VTRDGIRPEDVAEPAASEPAASEPAAEARFSVAAPINLRLTLAPLRHGRSDPTIRFAHDCVWLARRTPAGPATLRLWTEGSEAAVHAQAWGPGSTLALDAVPALAGLLDNPDALFARHRVINEIQRRLPGLRMPQTGQPLPSLIAAITEQKVTTGEAHASYAALVRRLGEPAPGPAGLLLTPSASRLAALPYFEFHPMGLERRRAELISRVAGLEARIEALTAVAPAEAYVQLQHIPGIGPWTAAETTSRAFGDPDAVSLGDAHLPDLVAWALAHEARADDTRMLELLEPYLGQRGRVVRLLEAADIRPPRFGPRFSPRRIGRI
jgi:3-methyladenine DNA glycosylase/8-oxoguanine DNA glycosylase